MAKRRKRKLNLDEWAEEIVPVSEASPYARVLVYAKNGKGKTRFAASAPDCLILDCNEEGVQSARRTDAHVRYCKDWFDLVAGYWFLKRGDHPYKSFAIDTLTGMQAMCMNYVLDRAANRDPTKDDKTASQRDYGTLANVMGEQLLRYRNLPMHCVFTAQERTYGDPEEGEPLVTAPDMTPRVRGVAMGAVGVIGRMYQKEVRAKKTVKGKTRKVSRWEVRMLVGPHEEYETKDRTLVLPRIMRNPSMDDIINAYETKE